MKDYKNFAERLDDFHSIVNELKSLHSFHDINLIQTVVVETDSPFIAYMRPMGRVDTSHGFALLETEGKVIHLMCIDDGSICGIFAAKGHQGERIEFTCASDIVTFADTLKKGIWR